MKNDRLARILLVCAATVPHWFVPWVLYPSGYGKLPFFVGVVALAALLVFFSMRASGPDAAQRVWWLPWRSAGGLLQLALLVFVGVMAVTAVFGVDPWQSVWGEQARQGGMLVYATLVAFALLLGRVCARPSDRRLFDWLLVGSAAAIVLVVFLEAVDPGIRAMFREDHRFSAWFGNPAFLGGYLALVVPYALRLLGSERGVWRRGLVVALMFAAAYAVFLCGSRGGALALVVGMCVSGVVWIGLALRSGSAWRKRAPLVALVLLIAIIAVSYFTPVLRRPFRRVFSPQALFVDNQPRFIMWQTAWEGFLERPLLGWGPEHFRTVFDRLYHPELLAFSFYETVADKAHNLPLELLATGGVPLFAAWVCVLVAALVASLRWVQAGRMTRLEAAAVWGVVASYVTSTAFLFDILPTSFVLFSVCGFLVVPAGAPVEGGPVTASRRVLTRWTLAAGVFLIGCFAAVQLFLAFPASVAVVGALDRMQERSAEWPAWRRAALGIPSPYRHENRTQLAFALLRSENVSTWPAAFLLQETQVLREAVADSATRRPWDFQTQFVLAQLLTQEGEMSGNDTLLAEAEAVLARAEQLSPKRQAVQMQAGRVALSRGHAERAVAILQKLVDAGPGLAEPHWFLGIALDGAGERGRAADELRAALNAGRRIRNRTEAEFMIDVFAAEKRWDDVVAVYSVLLEQQPYSGDLHARLAATYASAGKIDLAILEAQRAAQYDPAYAAEAEAFVRSLQLAQ